MHSPFTEHGLNGASRCSLDFRGFPYNPCLLISNPGLFTTR